MKYKTTLLMKYKTTLLMNEWWIWADYPRMKYKGWNLYREFGLIYVNDMKWNDVLFKFIDVII